MVEEDLWDMVEEEGVQVQEEGVYEESTKILLSVISVTSWDNIKMNVLYGKKMQIILSLKMMNCF